MGAVIKRKLPEFLPGIWIAWVRRKPVLHSWHQHRSYECWDSNSPYWTWKTIQTIGNRTIGRQCSYIVFSNVSLPLPFLWQHSWNKNYRKPCLAWANRDKAQVFEVTEIRVTLVTLYIWMIWDQCFWMGYVKIRGRRIRGKQGLLYTVE